MKKTKVDDSIWDVYFDSSLDNQEISSSKTARNQTPRTFKVLAGMCYPEGTKLLDVGCGSKNQAYKESVESIGINYFGCDLYNKPKQKNLDVIAACKNSQADVVSLNNVLNTVSQFEVRISILEQCHNALKEDSGILYVLIYEGTRTAKEMAEGVLASEMESMETRDGWQRRAKTEVYVSEVEEVFDNVIIGSAGGVKLILASKDKTLDLKEKLKQAHLTIKSQK